MPGTEDREYVLRTFGLAKRFGDLRAVDGIDLCVRRGEIYGFLGRNGAGKTTTIRMVLGLMRPSAGEVELFGKRLVADRGAILARVGFFVEGASAYPNLTVRENLEIQQRLKGAPAAAVGEALERLRLGEYASRRAGHLSSGNKQRLSLARALLGSPDFLILDEPANGLDPAGIVEVRGLLQELASQRGTAIFMSSHILAEVEQLADRIGIIHRGRLLEELDREMYARRRRSHVELTVDDPARAEALLRSELSLTVRRGPGAGDLLVDAGDGRGEKADCAAMARLLVGAGIGLERLVTTGEDLEEHFMRLTGGES
jgi:ABC-2 type transport system ATP-binding protein